MADEWDRLQAEVKAGQGATELLKNPYWGNLLVRIKAQVFDMWANTSPSQTKEREEGYYFLLALQKIEGTIRQDADNLESAMEQLQEITNDNPTGRII